MKGNGNLCWWHLLPLASSCLPASSLQFISSLFYAAAPSHAVRCYVGRAEDTNRPNHPPMPIRHSFSSVWRQGSRKANYTPFWQVPYLQGSMFYEEHKTNKQGKTTPRVVGLCGEKKNNIHIILPLLIQHKSSADSWRTRLARQQVSSAEIITSVSDIAP